MYGTVIAQKHDCDGNHFCCWANNPILDMHMYDLEFPNGKVTPLSANLIAQAMNAQYHVNGNEYLLLECFVDIQKDPIAVSLDEQ